MNAGTTLSWSGIRDNGDALNPRRVVLDHRRALEPPNRGDGHLLLAATSLDQI